MAEWDEDGNEKGFTLPQGERKIVVVTHDESTFHAYDSRRSIWVEKGEMPLRPKGKGRGIMVSDFLYQRGRLAAPRSITEDWLSEHNLRRHATEFFEYSKNNYWTAEKMVHQVKTVAILLFELAFPKDEYEALFLFDNSSNHGCMPDDALLVSRMNLGLGGKQAHMRSGINSLTGEEQPMDFPNGEQKGIRVVLQERGLWREKLRLDCKGTERQEVHPQKSFCCARHVLAAEPDFQAHQMSLLEQAITDAGHSVLFYPKFHCELNAIEYYWGAAKHYTRENCDYSFPSLRIMVPASLESISSTTIWRFFKKTERMMDYYREGVQYGSEEFKKREQERHKIVYKSHRRVGTSGARDL